MNTFKMNRRRFFGEASCLAVGSLTLYNSMLHLGMSNALAGYASDEEDYKALVCILLSGGNDSFNMLIPTADGEYGDYAATRSNLAIPKGDILPLEINNQQGRSFGLHPSMTGLQQLFNAGEVAFVSNVGTLIEPSTKEQIENNQVRLPLGLLSHSDQAMQWQTSLPHDRNTKGWGGRMADLLMAGNENQQISMNISLSGNNFFQSGNQAIEYSINSDTGGVGIFGYNEDDFIHQIQTAGINSLLNQDYEDVFKKSYARVIRNSIDSNERFNEAIGQVEPFQTVFSPNYVSQGLQMIARTIAARKALGMRRQTFFLAFGGWDHHDELLNNQIQMLGMLSDAFTEFNAALKEISMSECVTTFTISDFARTLTSNGNGTDHAWGGNAIVMGGPVKGNGIYGEYPSLALRTSYELGNGILVPTTSADEYFAELALWFGVPRSELAYVLPNLGNFYSSSSTESPIGFLNT